MIRQPAVAGHFYPGERRALLRAVESCLEQPQARFEAKGVVSPHAGYIYSGRVAGAVLGAVRLPRRVLLLGPNHTGRGAPLALFPQGEWHTPLGAVPIDDEMNGLLLGECADLREDAAAHAGEHCLEVQLPFLQAQKQDLSIAAICIGTSDPLRLRNLGEALARVARGLSDPVLLLVSSDMTHYEPAASAAKRDRLAIDRVLAVDPEGLHQTVMRHDITMCGFAPAVAALWACRDLGAREGRLLRYAHSGEVSGESGSVVGYAGMAVI